MPPSPTTIPTSFVPKQPVRTASQPQYQRGGGNTFLYVSFLVLLVVIIASGAVFAYQQYLTSARNAKAEEVKQAQERINNATVEDFIQTRNRFIAASTLLDKHVTLSSFFSLLESLTLETVRFNSFNFKRAEDGTAEIIMDGVARSFNALAAESSIFAGEKRIKRAIFSDISVDQNNSVTFSLSAELDPRLITFSAEATDTLPQTEALMPQDTQASSAVNLDTGSTTSQTGTTTTP